MAAAAALAERLGHEVVADRHPPDWFDDELADRLIVVRTMALAAELDGWASRLGRAVGEDDVEPANWWSAQLGRSLPATEYLRAQDWMNSWRRRVAAFWRAGAAHDSRAEDDDRFDLLLTPVLGDVTPPLGRLSDPVEGARRLRALLGFVDQANVTGQPAISLPTAMADPAPAGPALAGLAAPAGRAMPVGVQLVAASGNEALLLAVAQQVSDADGFVPLPELPSAP
ncbi:MAG TPA: hypothetical protein DEP66_03520 [Acidimicrobiaceae bacterium]|nr:hypothetical protein [Acidimicrobiaceae bacterium]